MRHLRVFLVFVAGYFWAVFVANVIMPSKAEPTLPPIEVTVPACEWGGPYPYGDTTEMWVVICAKGEGDV